MNVTKQLMRNSLFNLLEFCVDNDYYLYAKADSKDVYIKNNKDELVECLSTNIESYYFNMFVYSFLNPDDAYWHSYDENGDEMVYENEAKKFTKKAYKALLNTSELSDFASLCQLIYSQEECGQN